MSLLDFVIAGIVAAQSGTVDVPPIMQQHIVSYRLHTCGSSTGDTIACGEPVYSYSVYCLDVTRVALQSGDGKWHCIKFSNKLSEGVKIHNEKGLPAGSPE